MQVTSKWHATQRGVPRSSRPVGSCISGSNTKTTGDLEAWGRESSARTPAMPPNTSTEKQGPEIGAPI
ncbi:hypothetical protein MC885_007862 [Smutsia gigantea]|nr:hypothetical protein MC885_007862 [Smutsia gigantea]